MICGLSDVLDGIIARKTNTASSFGARLDTIADFIFVTVLLIKILSGIGVFIWLWIWIIAIAGIKISNIVLWWYVLWQHLLQFKKDIILEKDEKSFSF